MALRTAHLASQPTCASTVDSCIVLPSSALKWSTFFPRSGVRSCSRRRLLSPSDERVSSAWRQRVFRRAAASRTGVQISVRKAASVLTSPHSFGSSCVAESMLSTGEKISAQKPSRHTHSACRKHCVCLILRTLSLLSRICRRRRRAAPHREHRDRRMINRDTRARAARRACRVKNAGAVFVARIDSDGRV